MIHFKEIRSKNFMSTGQEWSVHDLGGLGTTLMVGSNGHGKSQFIDAICYAIYNKPFRKKIPLPKLVNTFNKKDMLVELSFESNGHDYLIRRGQKPKVFEIIKNGMPLDSHGSSKDSQAALEAIIGMGYQAFTQIVILGSGKYTPFMDLTTPERRPIVEDILGIGILSDMAKIAKEDLSLEKKTFGALDIEMDKLDVRIEMLERQIASHNSDREEDIRKATLLIEDASKDYKERIGDIAKLDESIAETVGDDPYEISSKVSKGKLLQQKTQGEIDNIRSEIEKYKSSDNCPSCGQDIPHDHFDNDISALEAKLPEKVALLTKIENALVGLNEAYDKAKETQSIKEALAQERNRHHSQAEILKERIITQRELIEKFSKDIDPSIQEELNGLTDKRKSIAEEAKLSEEKIKTTTEAISILSDKGVKAAIISDYVPLINEKINDHLFTMGLPFHLTLDENFKETILARNDDSLSYNSFSQGEKARLDLAILFTWRDIAKQRNSVSTNLLIMDEVFDGSMDTQGTEEVAEIIKGLGDDTSIIVISHNTENMLDKFDRVLSIRKVGGFTEIEEIEI